MSDSNSNYKGGLGEPGNVNAAILAGEVSSWKTEDRPFLLMNARTDWECM